MSAITVVHGTIRTVAEKRSQKGNDYREVSILTEFGGHLGETIRVYVFEPRSREEAPLVAAGLVVNWVCEVEANGSYLNARFKGVASGADFDDALAAVGARPLAEPATV